MTRLPALLLAPIVLLQGSALRRAVPRMSPAAPRTGGARSAGALRLLVLGDSTAVGTGVEQMTDALAGQVAARIAEPVAWRVVGTNGLRSDDVVALVPGAVEQPSDRIVVCAGWNDALQLRSARAFGRSLDTLLSGLRDANPAARIVLVAAPRFGTFAVLPQPLRSVLAVHAAGLTRTASVVAPRHGAVLVEGLDGAHVASDRFHPDAAGYRILAERVLAGWA